MKLSIKKFDGLNTRELFEIYRLRVSVFVVEQNCAYQEVDEADLTALHLMLRDDGGALAAYCRVLPPEAGGTQALIGRVIAVRRRCGLGSEAVRGAMETALALPGVESLRVEAQSSAVPMYEKLGFQVVSEEYLEDGIPHKSMIYRP